MITTRAALACACALVACANGPARAAELVGVDFFGMLYDVAADSAATTNPRNTGIDTLSGIAFGPNGVLYGLDAATDHLWQIDITTGAASQVGFIGLDVTEGDLSFDPTTGTLYGVQTFGADRLYTIDPATGASTVVGTIIDGGDISAMAFTPSGELFVLDTQNRFIYQLDPSTAQIMSTFQIGMVVLGPAAGMVFDPATGFFLVADGGPNASNQFYVYSTAAGFLFPVGDLTVPDGLSGLTYIPEPTTALLLSGIAAVFVMRRRGKR